MARNQFPGICYQCKLPVDVGTGHYERVKGVGWRVKHANVSGDGRITCAEAKEAREKARNLLHIALATKVLGKDP